MGQQKTDAVARFFEYVSPEPMSGCWLWLGAIRKANQYAVFRVSTSSKQSNVLAHRFAYETFRGQIPQGKQLDHLCRTRCCVNPAHLEAVTAMENNLRGIGPAAINAAKTHCIHGHQLSGDNLYPYPTKVGSRIGRGCRMCRGRKRNTKEPLSTTNSLSSPN